MARGWRQQQAMTLFAAIGETTAANLFHLVHRSTLVHPEVAGAVAVLALQLSEPCVHEREVVAVDNIRCTQRLTTTLIAQPGVADEDDRLRADVSGLEVTCLGNLAYVPEKHPSALNNPLRIESEHLWVGIGSCVDPERTLVNRTRSAGSRAPCALSLRS